MSSWIGLGGGAVVVVALLAIGDPAAATAPALHNQDVTPTIDTVAATDLSARRRTHRHVRSYRKPYRGDVQPHYYARPYYYRPDGIAPFFPFRYGYGLDPSW